MFQGLDQIPAGSPGVPSAAQLSDGEAFLPNTANAETLNSELWVGFVLAAHAAASPEKVPLSRGTGASPDLATPVGACSWASTAVEASFFHL